MFQNMATMYIFCLSAPNTTQDNSKKNILIRFLFDYDGEKS